MIATPVRSLSLLAAVALAALAPACGLTPPIRNSGAAAAGGVEVAVRGQSCSETVESDWPGNNLVEAVLDVEVKNDSPSMIVVHRDGFKLAGPDGGAVQTSTWFASDPEPVDVGQTQTFKLRFMSRGGLGCSKMLTLESPTAITQGTAVIPLNAVRFVPAHALSGYGIATND